MRILRYVGTAAVVALLAACASVGGGGGIPSLARVYRDHFVIGAAAEPEQFTGPEADLLLRQFNGVTPENVMKPSYLSSAEDTYTFDTADAFVVWATDHKLKVHGHTLVWHQQAAEWMFRDTAGNRVPKDVLLQRLDDYVTTVVSRYKGKIYAWDVVNEVVDGSGLRRSPWYEIAGEEYIERAFLAARRADPQAKLLINEYDTTDKVKGEALFALVRRLLDKDIPVDGVGMQFHISLDYPSLKSITDSLTRFSELGLEIHITELDMSLNGDPDFRPEATPEDFLIRQGHRYREVFEIFKAFPAIASVTFWGFHDGHTWLTYLPVEKADWPLPFDAQLQPKYAFWGLADPTKLPSDVYLIGRKNEFRSTAPRGTPVVDGQEDDVWRNAPDMSISIYVQGSGAYGVGKALWDEGNLYVLIKVTDSNLSKKSGNAYEHDSAEIFVDERNDKTSDYQEDDAQYRFNFENAFSSRGNPAEYESAAAVTPTGYNVEVRIPLRFGAGEVGREIGFDLQINDDAGDGTRSSYTKWNDPTNESYRNTSGFGTLVLGE